MKKVLLIVGVFHRFTLVSGRFSYQKWILRIILNIPVYSKFSQRLKISHKKSSLKNKSLKLRIIEGFKGKCIDNVKGIQYKLKETQTDPSFQRFKFPT